MGEWKLVCRVADIPVLGARRIGRPQGMDVAVFRNAEGGVFALLDRCPHKGGPLSQGIVFGTSVACPLHNWTVGLDDGCARQPDEGRTPKFRVKVEDGAVYLDAVELASLGIDAAKPVAGPERCSRPASTPSSVVPSNARTQGVPDTEERSGFPPSRE
ncbi:MAG TPA: nitrite reductase small subunit NirD [Ramlibacter sp.]|uniref:nitrite reductase small subunit NirD n=1 Tax=Ramlibacter sp. TaxID=1917967 RepID=UPI002C0AD81C|nr:nitrite reductase small subunit NirD [Ramlibacter sp.]HVZ42946.1 nitrite reductase small subunit NirD [Ramlibacter sp.]